MSDYKPITSELRSAWIGQDVDTWMFDKELFDRLCDAIDAIHAGLERENAELRRQLDSLMYESRPMTDENMAAEGLVRLPKDADGEYIHVGDMLAGEKAGGFGLCEPFEVGCIMFGRGIVQVNDTHGLARCTEFAHHHRPDTWERIIEDALDGYHDTDFDKLVARCKKLAGDAE